MYITIDQFTEVVTEIPLPCNRCGGSGYLQEHRRISGGVCFKCDGKGTSLKVETVKNETVKTTQVKCEILEDTDTFEAMFERRQAKQKDFEAKIARQSSGEEEFDILSWYD